METVKLGKKGQISIPKGILKRLGLEGDVTLLVENGVTRAADQRDCVVSLENVCGEASAEAVKSRRTLFRIARMRDTRGFGF